MSTEVINLLAGLSVERAVFLASSLFALSLIPFFALLGVRFDRATRAVHQVAVHAGHDLNRARARAGVAVQAVRAALAHRIDPTTTSQKGATR